MPSTPPPLPHPIIHTKPQVADWLEAFVGAGPCAKYVEREKTLAEKFSRFFGKIIGSSGLEKAKWTASTVEAKWNEHKAKLSKDALAAVAAEEGALPPHSDETAADRVEDVFLAESDVQCREIIQIARAVGALGFDAATTTILQLKRYETLATALTGSKKPAAAEADWNKYLALHKPQFAQLPAEMQKLAENGPQSTV